MARIFNRINTGRKAFIKTKINSMFKGSSKGATKKVVAPILRPVSPVQANLSTQMPKQDCCCARRQNNRAKISRRKRQLSSQNLNQ